MAQFKNTKIKNLKEMLSRYKSLDHFVQCFYFRERDNYNYLVSNYLTRTKQEHVPKNSFLCWRCDGVGAYNVSLSYYDSERVNCSVCSGVGVLSKKVYSELRKAYTRVHQENLAEFRKYQKNLSAIQTKLTTEDKEFLTKQFDIEWNK